MRVWKLLLPWGNVQIRCASRLIGCLFRGPIPPDPHYKYGTLHVLHDCDVTSCVNPDDLFLGTAYENMQDASERYGWGSMARHVYRAKLNAQQVYEIWVSTDHPRALAKGFWPGVEIVKPIMILSFRRIWRYLEFSTHDRGTGHFSRARSA